MAFHPLQSFFLLYSKMAIVQIGYRQRVLAAMGLKRGMKKKRFNLLLVNTQMLLHSAVSGQNGYSRLGPLSSHKIQRFSSF